MGRVQPFTRTVGRPFGLAEILAQTELSWLGKIIDAVLATQGRVFQSNYFVALAWAYALKP